MKQVLIRSGPTNLSTREQISKPSIIARKGAKSWRPQVLRKQHHKPSYERQQSFDAGFTYIEILVVLSIMLIIGGSIGFNAIGLIDKARQASAHNQISIYKIALSSYYSDNGVYPNEEQGLSALWEKPHIAPIPANWDGPYLDKRPQKDPWNNEYIFKRINNLGLPYIIVSYGADGIEGGKENNADISSY